MRKNYVKPALISEEFVPQTYVAACEHTSSGAGMYKFVCDAGKDIGGGNLYKETNNSEGLQIPSCHCTGTTHDSEYGGILGLQRICSTWGDGDDTLLGGYKACKESHEAPTTDEFPAGYYVPYNTTNVYNVLLWQGDGDRHATSNLNRDTWQKNIS